MTIALAMLLCLTIGALGNYYFSRYRTRASFNEPTAAAPSQRQQINNLTNPGLAQFLEPVSQKELFAKAKSLKDLL